MDQRAPYDTSFETLITRRLTRLRCDLCVLGGGSGGLSVAAGAAQMGAKVVLIEKGRMGGDCLNTGCVPSKSLIAAAHVAYAKHRGPRFGINFTGASIDFGKVHDHVHDVIATIAPHDSIERFAGLGVMVIQEHGRFAGPGEIEAGPYRIRARRFVIATGSRPVVPPINGLDGVPFLTNEAIFDLTQIPERLVVIGGGPIGVEMAQAFKRLGSDVTLIEQFQILPRDEPEAAAVIRGHLRGDGIEILENASVEEVQAANGGVDVVVRPSPATRQLTIPATHLLLAAGRQPTIEDLGLDAAGIGCNAKGIEVNARLQTTNRRVFAVGDVAGGPQFTHSASYHAGIVIRNALFAIPAKTDYRALPWVTYSDPEVAHVGLTEAEARKTCNHITTLVEPFTGNDRAQAERDTDGLIKLVLGARGKILGATIVGPHAGELIGLWGLTIAQGLKLSAIAGAIVPYPTLSEISKKAAGSYYTPTLYGKGTKFLVRVVQRVIP